MTLRKPGFTLLEVLISMALLSSLMLVTWSLFRTYTRLQERGSESALKLQIARSLHRQLQSDLEHFACTPISESNMASEAQFTDGLGEATAETPDEGNEQESEAEDSGNAPVAAADASEFGAIDLGASDLIPASGLSPRVLELQSISFLKGGPTRLEFLARLPDRVEVPRQTRDLQLDPIRYPGHQLVVYNWQPEPTSANLYEFLNQPDQQQKPSQLTPPLGEPSADSAPPANPFGNYYESVGLVREAKSWQQVLQDRRQESLRMTMAAQGLNFDEEMSRLAEISETDGAMASTDASMTPPLPQFPAAREHVPEITRLQFRYHDGSQWLLNWDSGSDGRLPLAVEVAFDIDAEAVLQREQDLATATQIASEGGSLAYLLEENEAALEDDQFDTESLIDPITMADPTAIRTEFRCVIGVPSATRDEPPRRVDTEEQLRGPESLVP